MSNFNQMVRQAQALQRKMAKAQEELATREVKGSAGGGAVVVVANGNGEMKTVTISPEVVDPDDVDLLGDLFVAAVNEALRAARALEADLMGDVSTGLGLPPGIV